MSCLAQIPWVFLVHCSIVALGISICDYATCYPEAITLKLIRAEVIAEELVKLFAWVGIPQEVLTDQGSNFTSTFLAELYRIMHNKPIRTSPYHPQMDELVDYLHLTIHSTVCCLQYLTMSLKIMGQ